MEQPELVMEFLTVLGAPLNSVAPQCLTLWSLDPSLSLIRNKWSHASESQKSLALRVHWDLRRESLFNSLRGVRGDEKKLNIVHLRIIRFPFWGVSCSNWGWLLAHFLFLGGDEGGYFFSFFEVFRRESPEMSGPPASFLSPAKFRG